MQNDSKYYRQILIQRYVDRTITNEELSELQELLKSDASVRNELLLYVRIDIAIRDYVLFHNYMDESSSLDAVQHDTVTQTKKETCSHEKLPSFDVFLKRMLGQSTVPAIE